MDLNQEQKRSQISDSHRLMMLTGKLRHRLDTHEGYGKNHTLIDKHFFLNDILGRLDDDLNSSIAQRQSALLKRVKTRVGEYAGQNLTAIEYAAEVLFDSYFFRKNNMHVSRQQTVSLIKESINVYGKIILVMPILSRKPFSPIKNKGMFPDLGEINTLLRCAELAKLIGNVSGFHCEFIILADGNKYNRACKTPSDVVGLYQQALRYWTEYFQIGDYVKVKDYEQWIFENDDFRIKEKRNNHFLSLYKEISVKYDRLFNVDLLNAGFATINEDDIGRQLMFTFWSIVTSVNYDALYSGWQRGSQIYTNENQNFYISFITSLAYPSARIARSHLFAGDIVGSLSHSAAERVMNMRHEAWESAKRYVAISLADRHLNTIFRKIPTALKLTIHAKMGEYGFVSTNPKNYAMTAQHTVAGIKFSNDQLSIDYQYRLIREAERQIAVYIQPLALQDHNFDPLYEMSLLKQPVYYISNQEAA